MNERSGSVYTGVERGQCPGDDVNYDSGNQDWWPKEGRYIYKIYIFNIYTYCIHIYILYYKIYQIYIIKVYRHK